MTCKDCLHCEPCFRYGNVLDPLHGGVVCDYFKPKSDFFEIVRCENCENGEKYIISRSKNGVEKEAILCKVKSRFKGLDEWCRYGERKDT